MHGTMVAFSRKIALMASVTLSLGWAVTAHAAEPPFPAKRLSLSPNQQPIADTIKDLFAQSGLSVKVSSKVTGKAAARWIGSPADIWKQISKAYNVVAYYNGSVVRVYDASEIASRTINAADPNSVVQQAQKLGLISAGNSVKASKNAVIVSGVPEFIENVAQLANRAAPPPPVVAPPAITPVAPPPVIAAVPTTSDVVSPLNKPSTQMVAAPPAAGVAMAAMPSSYKLEYNVASRASRGDPYEIRIYSLKYAKAADKVINTGDGTQLFRGVSSMLREMVGLSLDSIDDTVGRASPNGARRLEESGGGNYQNYPQQNQQSSENAHDSAPSRSNEGPLIAVYNAGNAVLVRDLPTRMAKYDALIEALDRQVAQIDVQVTIIDIDTTKSRKLGISWEGAFNLGGNIVGINTDQANGANVGVRYNDREFSTQTNFLNAQISALSQRGVLKIVKRTNISTPENIPGTSDARQVIPLKVNGSQYQNGSVVEYRIGIFLNVTPSVAKERDGLNTQMEIDIRDGNIGGYLPDGTPTFEQHLLTTTAFVRQGESYVIGGFSAEMSYDGTSKIPGLGDIPLAGQLFRKSTKESSVKERLVILTPRILSNRPNNLVAASPDEDEAEEPEEVEELSSRKLPTKKVKAKSKPRTI